MGFGDPNFYFTMSQLYQLGFSEYFIYNSAERDAAFMYGFRPNKLMLGIGSKSSYSSQLTDVNTPDAITQQYYPTGFIINRCYIDEPYENNSWGWGDIDNCANSIGNYHSGTLTLSSWHAPAWPYTYSVSNHSNVYMMCDQYQDKDLFNDYWNPYKLVYGSKNVTNWMSQQYQAGPAWGYDYTAFGDCFTSANNLGMNELWLFAGLEDLGKLEYFCTCAYQAHWY